MSKKQQWFTNGALLLTSLLVGFLLCEFLVRLYFFGPFALHPDMILRPFRSSIIIQKTDVPELPYELVPHMSAVHAGVMVDINSHGLRDQEYTVKKPPNTVRIAVIGDSFSMPMGVAIDDAYHSRLEKEFNEEGGLNYEFLNFAISGFGLRHYNAVLEHRVLPFEPDLIVIGLCIRNDANDSQPGLRGDGQLSRVYSWYTKVVFDLLRKKKGALRTHGSSEPPRKRKMYVQRQLAKMATFSQKHDIPILLSSLEYHPYFFERERFFRDTASVLDLPFVPMIRHFDQMRTEDYHIFPWDGHPNAVAHEIFAEMIRPYLLDALEFL